MSWPVGPACPWPLRCKVTGNPCGVDVRQGFFCRCDHCRIFAATRQAAAR